MFRRVVAEVASAAEGHGGGAKTSLSIAIVVLVVLSAIGLYQREVRKAWRAQKDVDRSRDLLVGELAHRVKNTLAVVQSIARQSLSTGNRLDGLAAFEPAYVDELAVIMAWAFDYMQREAPEETATTVGGLLNGVAGHVPRAGERFDYDGLHFEVVEANQRKVLRLRVRRRETDASNS